MSRASRVRNIILGVIMIAGAVLILSLGRTGYYIVLFMLTFSMLAWGIKDIVFYFGMAKNMVGGLSKLINGVLITDAGLFMLTLAAAGVDPRYVMFALLLYSMFNGVIDIMRSMESKKLRSNWRMKFFGGLITILIGVGGMVLNFVFPDNLLPVLGVFTLMLAYSGGYRIARAFKKTAITYITP